ncbi:hypothetical protein OC861_004942 [Tilletia horrida]|nr:hypothetical protein OC861_004942 [Tilletia horrida]
MTSIAIPAAASAAGSPAHQDTAATITSLLNIIHNEASQAKSSTDSAIVLPSSSPSSNAATPAQFSPTVVQSPAPALLNTDGSSSSSSSLPLSDISRILKPIADSLRSDPDHKLKHSLASSTLLPKSVVSLLQLTTSLDPVTTPDLTDAQTHILRLLANLCIDSDTNRTIMLQVEAPQTIIHFLTAKITPPPSSFTSSAPSQQPGFYHPQSTTPVLRTAIGALLNMQLQHEPTRVALRANQSNFAILAHIAYSPAIYPMNASTALLKGPQFSGQANLAFSSIAHIQDAEEALEELQARSMTASWASQILLDLCSERPPQSEQGAEAKAAPTDSADQGQDLDDDDDDEEEGELPGEPNPKIIAANVPLSALLLPLAAYVPSSSPTHTTIKVSTAQLSEALTADEDALLTLLTADITLLQNSVQLLDAVISDVPAGAVEQESATEVAGPSESTNAEATGSVRPKMLQRAELVRVPWPASAEAPALSQWLDTVATPFSTQSSSTAKDDQEAGTPTRADSSQSSSSSSSGLSLLMNFIERGSAPVLHTPSSFSPSADVILRAGATSFQRWTLSMASALVELVSDDVCMEALFPPIHLLKAPVVAEGGADQADGSASSSSSSTAWFVDALKRWMRTIEKEITAPGGAEYLQSTALLAMGNLARTDSHCIALVQEHNLAPFLVSLLPTTTFIDSTTSPTPLGHQIRLAHSVLSLLKNLSIPEPNKRIIGSLGVISRVVEGGYLEIAFKQEGSTDPKATRGVPLQLVTAAVGLVKHLCRGEVEAAIEVVLGRQPASSSSSAAGAKGAGAENKTALEMLLTLITKTDEVAVRMESTRIIVGVVKSLWSSTAPTGDNEAAVRAAKALLTTASSTPVAAPVSADQSVPSPSIAQAVRAALAQMVRTAGKYPILVNEGVVALTLLASENAESADGVAQALLWEPARGASGNSGTSGGSGSTAMAPPGVPPLVSAAPILGGPSVSAPDGIAELEIPSVIMAEPESFEPNPAAAEAAAAPASSGGLGTGSSLRAGPVSSLLRTETNLPPPAHASQQGSAAPDAALQHGSHANSLLSHQHPHGQPGPRRQSTAEVYGQAGVAAAAAPIPPASPGRSPLGLSASGEMDIDSPSSSAPAVPEPTNLAAAPHQQQQQQAHAPIRRGSTTANALTSPKPSALSMLDVVLGRRDARMPPHFASNAAVLVQIVVSAPSSPSQAKVNDSGSGDKVGAIAVGMRTEESLERLAREGPEEALDAAEVALRAVRQRLGKA